MKMCIRDSDTGRHAQHADHQEKQGRAGAFAAAEEAAEQAGRTLTGHKPVSYTHLDVYKRQFLLCHIYARKVFVFFAEWFYFHLPNWAMDAILRPSKGDYAVFHDTVPQPDGHPALCFL